MHAKRLPTFFARISVKNGLSLDNRLADWLLCHTQGREAVATHREITADLLTAREVISRRLRDFASWWLDLFCLERIRSFPCSYMQYLAAERIEYLGVVGVSSGTVQPIHPVRHDQPRHAIQARSASRARSSRFGSFTCGTSRKTGAVILPRPVFERDTTARPFVFSRPSATSRLGPVRR